MTIGKGRGIVVATGISTAIGEIQRDIAEQEVEKTPLKRRLDEFGDSLAKVITVICILVWLINIRHFGDDQHGSYIKASRHKPRHPCSSLCLIGCHLLL